MWTFKRVPTSRDGTVYSTPRLNRPAGFRLLTIGVIDHARSLGRPVARLPIGCAPVSPDGDWAIAGVLDRRAITSDTLIGSTKPSNILELS